MQSDRTTDLHEEASVTAGSYVRLKPVGFFSYSRQDDELSGGKLSKLRALLLSEIQQQYGRDRVQLFQDVSAISHGSDWEGEIRNSLDKSTFLIPIITPNFVQSEWCCAEVTIFLQREKKLFERFPDLPKRSRVFPIHLIDVTGVDPYDRHVLAALETRQWMDFRPLRFQPLSEPIVHQTIASLATSIRELLTIKVRKPLTEKERAAAAAEASAALDRASERRAVEEGRRDQERQAQQRAAARARDADAHHKPLREPAPSVTPRPAPPPPTLEKTRLALPPTPAVQLTQPPSLEKMSSEADAAARAQYQADVRAFAESDWDGSQDVAEEPSFALVQYAMPILALIALVAIVFAIWTMWGSEPDAAPPEAKAAPRFETYSWLEGSWSSQARCAGQRFVIVPTREGSLNVTAANRTYTQQIVSVALPTVRTDTASYTASDQPGSGRTAGTAVNRLRLVDSDGTSIELRRC